VKVLGVRVVIDIVDTDNVGIGIAIPNAGDVLPVEIKAKDVVEGRIDILVILFAPKNVTEANSWDVRLGSTSKLELKHARIKHGIILSITRIHAPFQINITTGIMLRGHIILIVPIQMMRQSATKHDPLLWHDGHEWIPQYVLSRGGILD
jgi:hypothetical protein